MNVCLVWPDCTFSNNRWDFPVTSFWIAATEEEARKFFVDKLSAEHLEEFEKACEDIDYMDGWYRGHRDGHVVVGLDKNDELKVGFVNLSQFREGESDPQDDKFRFLVAKDMSRVDLGFAVYPFSGMWNGRSPFKEFKMEISSPEELINLL